jgi:putative transposase
MPWGLKRFQESCQLHFVTFSCYRRRPLLCSPARREWVERALEGTRRGYRFFVTGYVVMPEHVHLLVSEPERRLLATAIQAMKQSVARRLALRSADPFWQARYYDFNVWSEDKRIEKLNYMHWNPVKRGLVSRPEDWPWSSFHHYATGCEGIVEIESQWTARRRERLGVAPQAVKTETKTPTRAKPARVGHPREWAIRDARPGHPPDYSDDLFSRPCGTGFDLQPTPR